MKNSDHLISIDTYLSDFKQYLKSNSRCIFSAKFGNGKSFFLSQFMEAEKNKYLFIPIYPVNYQVADNKDIFEYLKRDILIRLLSDKDVAIQDEVIEASLLLYSFLDNKRCDLIWDIFDLIPEIKLSGVSIKISEVLKKIKEISTEFKKYKNKFKSEDEISEYFITKFNEEKGSIYEFDAISQLICDIINRYKRNSNKQVVLIIEDLDRIDPAHLFRILNVFSAHLDRYAPSCEEFSRTNWKNKFCFDKIVTVCDFDNLRKIYAHFYGPYTDFDGYVSKFTSDSPFRYTLQSDFNVYIKNELIDKELLKYPHLCDYLISCISEKKSINLRLLRVHFMDVSARIIDTPIPLRSLKGYTIKAINDFTKVLVICRLFELNINDLLNWMRENVKNEMNSEIFAFVGTCWLLSDYFSMDITFKVGRNDVMTCTRDIKSANSVVEYYSDCRITDNIIEEFILPPNNWNNPKSPTEFMFNQLSNIVELLQEVIVLRVE